MYEIGKYLNPFTDFGFKKLFGNEFNKDLLIDFLNEVLTNKEKIKDLTYQNPEHLPKIKENRKSIVDLYCENDRGEKFIIELQNIGHHFFKDRSVYYATFPIQEQALKGKKWDYHLKAIYTVCILNFSFEDEENAKRYYREIKLMDTHTKSVFYDKLTFYYLEVPCFDKTEAELETNFDKWMFVLKHMHKLQEIPKKLQTKLFKKLFKEAEIANLNSSQMKLYEENLKIQWDEYSILKSQKEDGRIEGRIEEKLMIATELKKNGVALHLIVKSTGLTKEEVEKL